MKKCAKCHERPRAHPKAAYCAECRREYNRALRARPPRDESLPEDVTPRMEDLMRHLAEGGQCSDYQRYWDMTPRAVSRALGWYESNNSQKRESESS